MQLIIRRIAGGGLRLKLKLAEGHLVNSQQECDLNWGFRVLLCRESLTSASGSHKTHRGAGRHLLKLWVLIAGDYRLSDIPRLWKGA